MKLDIKKFLEIQGCETDSNICKKMGISRTQLWRAKKGDKVGEKFISCFKSCYPTLLIDDYFFNDSVT